MNGKLLFTFLSLIVATLNCGCGYQFQGSASVLPSDVKSVYIPLVENRTAESRLGVVLTEALRDQFERFHAVSVVDDLNAADAELDVVVLSVARGNGATTAETDTSLQQQLVITASGKLKKITGQLLWSVDRMNVTRTYGTTSSSIITSTAGFAGSSLNPRTIGNLNSRELARGQEEQALSDMADELAAKIYQNAVAPDF